MAGVHTVCRVVTGSTERCPAVSSTRSPSLRSSLPSRAQGLLAPLTPGQERPRQGVCPCASSWFQT